MERPELEDDRSGKKLYTKAGAIAAKLRTNHRRMGR